MPIIGQLLPAFMTFQQTQIGIYLWFKFQWDETMSLKVRLSICSLLNRSILTWVSAKSLQLIVKSLKMERLNESFLMSWNIIKRPWLTLSYGFGHACYSIRSSDQAIQSDATRNAKLSHTHNFNKSCKVPQVNATLSQVFRTSDLHVILICYRHYLKKKKIGVVSGSIG